MEILQTISDAAKQGGRRFLLIGGHALNVHGVSRSTGDLDLMVEAADAAFWKGALERLGYDIFHESSGFMQSKPPSITAWPVDLMLVNAETMTKALADSINTTVLGPSVQVASLGSLIAMKLHALKFVDEVRALKDQSDLLALLEISKIAPDSEAFRQLCIRYGTLEWYERIAKFKR
jgi:hypothetical protein